MFGKPGWRSLATICFTIICVLVWAISPIGSGDALAAWGWQRKLPAKPPEQQSARVSRKLTEVAPPAVLLDLAQYLEKYQPQVKILSPRPNEVLKTSTVSVRFQVNDLPIFKNEALGLGPHLHVLLDNQTYQAVYDLSQPLVLTDLQPGTHTIRAFASRPWHESFKNEGAYAQTTFHVFTKTQENSPDAKQPLLTYSRPQGSYGAEPIMLDFYLTNAPLHFVAREDGQDDIADWRIRCTVNGESFIFDRWQPIYLKGFQPGQNWVQLEYLDEHGNLIKNEFNNTARVITYEPEGSDTLSKLVRGELAIADVRGIVDPTYVPPVPEPEPTIEPEPESEPLTDQEPVPTPQPAGPSVPLPPNQVESATQTDIPPTPVEPSTSDTPTPAAQVPDSDEQNPSPEAQALDEEAPKADIIVLEEKPLAPLNSSVVESRAVESEATMPAEAHDAGPTDANLEVMMPPPKVVESVEPMAPPSIGGATPDTVPETVESTHMPPTDKMLPTEVLPANAEPSVSREGPSSLPSTESVPQPPQQPINSGLAPNPLGETSDILLPSKPLSPDRPIAPSAEQLNQSPTSLTPKPQSSEQPSRMSQFGQQLRDRVTRLRNQATETLKGYYKQLQPDDVPPVSSPSGGES